MPSAERRPVVVLGSLNLDLVLRVAQLPSAGQTVAAGEVTQHPGGKGANQAVAAARLGARVAMFGRVGADDAGHLLRQSLSQDGVDVAGVAVDAEAPTGQAVVVVDAAGENQIVVMPGANARVSTRDAVAAAEAAAGGVLLMQLEIPHEVVQAAAAAAGDTAVVVLNAAPARSDLRELLPPVDVLVVNDSEAAVLGVPGSDLGRSALVVTKGERGAVLFGHGSAVEVPAFTVQPVDTTAAGDAFTGTLVAGLASGLDLETCCRLGSAAGALATTRAGAQPSLPDRAVLRRFLKGTDLASISF